MVGRSNRGVSPSGPEPSTVVTVAPARLVAGLVTVAERVCDQPDLSVSACDGRQARG